MNRLLRGEQSWQRLAAFAVRAFHEWTTPLLLVALLHIFWQTPLWLADIDGREFVVEAAAELAAAVAVAVLFAAALGLLWTACGGLAKPPWRAARMIAALSTTGAAGALALVLALTLFLWLGDQGFALGVRVREVILLGVAAALVTWLVAGWRRSGSLDGVSLRVGSLSRRSVLGIVPACFAALWWGGMRWRPYSIRLPAPAAARNGDSDRPNFLLVTFDALTAADMPLYGYHLPTTPNIDRFARGATVFERFIAASNFTTSSVASILTGKSVSKHGCFYASYARIPDRFAHENLAFELGRQGYTTAAVVANPYAHPTHFGLENSFDYLPPPPLVRVPGTDAFYHLTHSDIGLATSNATDARLRAWAIEGRLMPYPGTVFPPALAFDRALAFLETQRGPYFLWIHLLTPHSPYEPPGPFLGRFLAGGEYSDARAYPNSAVAAGMARDRHGEPGLYSPEVQGEVDKVRLRYDEFVAYADDAFGRFIDRFDELSVAANTAVMVSADHGENFTHGFWGHGDKGLWQPTIHVPFVVRLPGQTKQGARVRGLAGHVDLMPTILDLAKAPIPPWCDGVSLVPMLQGNDVGHRCVSELVDSRNDAPIVSGGIAVFENGDKFVLDVASGAGRLYDLLSDPQEDHDLSNAKPKRVEELREIALGRVRQSNSLRA